MKISTTMLGIAIGCVFGGVLAFLVFLRMTATPFVEKAHAVPPPSGSDRPVTQSYDFDRFSGVAASGVWDIQLKRGETYSVEIEMPEYLIEGVDIRLKQEDLHLGLKRGWRLKRGSLKARIISPSIARIRVSGAANVRLDGFECDRLAIKASGAARISGNGNRVGSLAIDGSGSFQLDFKNNPVTSADVDLSGSSLVELTMAGGDLKGSISGSGKVIFDGRVSLQGVRISGSGRVEQRQAQ